MVNNKNPGHELKDARQGHWQEEKKDKSRDASMDEQRDASRKNDKTAQSRKDRHGKK